MICRRADVMYRQGTIKKFDIDQSDIYKTIMYYKNKPVAGQLMIL